MCATSALQQPGHVSYLYDVSTCIMQASPHIKATLSDVLATWFSVRMSRVRLRVSNKLMLLEWKSGDKREAERSIRVVLLGGETLGSFNFPCYILCPNIKFLQQVGHIKRQPKLTTVEPT